MKKIALYLIFAFSTIVATAQTRFDVDGLTYEILSESDRTVEVHDGSNANEILSIPETVSYNGVNYTVTSIGEAALKYCRWLISVDMPNSVTIIGDEAFFGCYVLTSIDIPDCVTSIGDYAFQECDRLTSIAIPNSVISIGIGAFWNCTELTSVTIPNSVTYIGGAAFYNCSKLTSITIPNSVTSIGESTFMYCHRLQEIINLAEEPQRITSDVFSVVQLGNVRLIVPSSSVEKYKSADVWKEFGTIEGQDAGVGAVETDKIVVSGGVLRNPEGEEIRIYDLNGREMYSGNGSELRFPAGFYILQTSNGNRKVVF